MLGWTSIGWDSLGEVLKQSKCGKGGTIADGRDDQTIPVNPQQSAYLKFGRSNWHCPLCGDLEMEGGNIRKDQNVCQRYHPTEANPG